MKIWNLPIIEIIPLAEMEEARPVILVTTAGAWEAVAGRLGQLDLAARLQVAGATLAEWDELAETMEAKLLMLEDPVIYAVGGGLAADAAKYLAKAGGMEMVMVPTALSVDASITWASGVRSGGCVEYIETKPPERMVVDMEVLKAAPASLRAAGICDVLSIATGLWDWQFAEARGRNPVGMEVIPWVVDAARAILEGALDCAQAAGAGDEAGLKQLLDCLAMEVQLCNQVGHSRPEEGSEHYFAYSVENRMGRGLPHGDLVGPGILIMAELQGQDTTRLQAAMQACHIPLDGIPQATVEATLKELPDYVRAHELPYAIAHELKDGSAR